MVPIAATGSYRPIQANALSTKRTKSGWRKSSEQPSVVWNTQSPPPRSIQAAG